MRREAIVAIAVQPRLLAELLVLLLAAPGRLVENAKRRSHPYDVAVLSAGAPLSVVAGIVVRLPDDEGTGSIGTVTAEGLAERVAIDSVDALRIILDAYLSPPEG